MPDGDRAGAPLPAEPSHAAGPSRAGAPLPAEPSHAAGPSRAGAPLPAKPPRAAEQRGPGWREVLLLAAAILVAVLLLELASAALPPVREAFRGFPVTIVVLVGGTVGLLLLGARRRPRA